MQISLLFIKTKFTAPVFFALNILSAKGKTLSIRKIRKLYRENPYRVKEKI
jgi:hypothetical protein